MSKVQAKIYYHSSVKYLHLTCHYWVVSVMAQSEYTMGSKRRSGSKISTIVPDFPAKVNTDTGHRTKWLQTFIYYQTFREGWDERIILTRLMRVKKKSHGDKSFRSLSVGIIIIIIDKPQMFTQHPCLHSTQSALYRLCSFFF